MDSKNAAALLDDGDSQFHNLFKKNTITANTQGEKHMARREVTQIFDDLDNQPLDEADVRVIRFAVNGTDYVLDVSEKNANRFYEIIGPYVEAARKVPSIRTHKGATIAAYDPKQVREWAIRNGYTVARRGKLSQEIIDAYLAVNS